MNTEIIVIPKQELEAMLARFAADLRADMAAQIRQAQPRTLPDLLTRKEAANELRVSVKTVDNYARAGLLTKVATAAGVRFRRGDVEKMKNSMV